MTGLPVPVAHVRRQAEPLPMPSVVDDQEPVVTSRHALFLREVLAHTHATLHHIQVVAQLQDRIGQLYELDLRAWHIHAQVTYVDEDVSKSFTEVPAPQPRVPAIVPVVDLRPDAVA